MTVSKHIEELLGIACKKQASDIFIIPYKNDFQISFKVREGRIDYELINDESGNQLINFFKFQGGMDISEHRRPQIGSTKYLINKEEINLRLSSVGNYLGKEILVIRLIYVEAKNIELPENFNKFINKKGLILFSGPMGSGKTSFMYSYAKKISTNKLVMCIEDPTEIIADDFVQLQINDDAGIGYEELIKSSLRQRPDILIIGEIRDSKTANLAVKAALSGYTVLSTIHAKSKYSVISRMKEFNVDMFSLKSSLIASVYQRLIPTKSKDLICLQDMLIDDELTTSFEHVECRELKDWEDKINTLYEEGVINQKVFEEFIHG
ncbi:competence protein [Companilactobacillus sp. RD055328]|uniref:competence type IV pilus ATPase ComGA n=1 Tax=Companilactobacillus sp. RD055328 TaxID=2916634 RepID=UPI001FC87405|nr:competence type IV pilus ATPase ComGA [Companilactobacillus sp. RD055328]GKQ42994.1 competence protein [Companilactobacillus sp. RD055328]